MFVEGYLNEYIGFLEKIEDRFPDENFTVKEFNNSLGKEAIIKCNNCGNEIKVSRASNFLIYSKRYGCKHCKGFYAERQKFINAIQQDYYIIGIGKFNENDTHLYYRIQCKKCQHIRTTSLKNIKLLYQCGCETGVYRNRTAEEFIQQVNEATYDNYILVGEYLGQAYKVQLQHIKCGFIYEVYAHDIVQGRSCCPRCRKSNSIGAQYITNLLVKNHIIFEKEKRLLNSKLRFDFYLENKCHKIAIEYNGIQHYKEVKFFTGSLETNQERDQRKKEYCLQNNIELYIIPYIYSYSDIENTINNILNRFNDYLEREQD